MTLHTERVIRWTVNVEPAVVIERVREEPHKDKMIQKLARRIVKGDWEMHKRDKNIGLYLKVKQELSIADGLIFRENRFVPPETLQKKIVQIGQCLGPRQDRC